MGVERMKGYRCKDCIGKDMEYQMCPNGYGCGEE
jgi:hypothetical protein